MTHRVKQTKDGKWIVANDYDGQKLAGPFDSEREAIIASAGKLPKAPKRAKDIRDNQKNAVTEDDAAAGKTVKK